MSKEFKEICFDLIHFNVVSSSDIRTIQFVNDLKKPAESLTENEFKTLILYFCFLQDGSSCLFLDDFLKARWEKKWNGLKEKRFVTESEMEIGEVAQGHLSELDQEKATRIEEYFNSYFDDLPQWKKSFKEIENVFYFDAKASALFAKKFWNAKESIVKSVNRILKKNLKKYDSEQKTLIQKKYRRNANQNSEGKCFKEFELKNRQAEAIVKGQENSLIITGGPGTGKTTVVFYLLLELLQKEEFKNFKIYLTAPSGKAADRLKESILESCENFPTNEITNEKIVQTLATIKNAESSTIHRLLKFQPQTNGFAYNAENQFEENSIFVIDEASMIGVTLFDKLLQAIPDSARVFILGDKDQLPSVDAGAAFEEILKIKENHVVELDESNRFNNESKVGKLALAMQKEKDEEIPKLIDSWPATIDVSKDASEMDSLNTHYGQLWTNLQNDYSLVLQSQAVQKVPDSNLKLMPYINGLKWKEKCELFEKNIKGWIDCFCKPCAEFNQLNIRSEDELNKIRRGEDNSTLEILKNIWNWSKRARILAAERRGIYGIENINKVINNVLRNNKEHFAGQFLMITQNQSALDLFNGDSGIVIMVGESSKNQTPYLMLEKEVKIQSSHSKVSENNSCKFAFYRLDLIPSDSYELAYAITVHKSQGSGYDHLLFFLPENPQSLLANRQILYTGITRIQKGILTIVGSKDIFISCCNNRLVRYTGISLNH